MKNYVEGREVNRNINSKLKWTEQQQAARTLFSKSVRKKKKLFQNASAILLISSHFPRTFFYKSCDPSDATILECAAVYQYVVVSLLITAHSMLHKFPHI